MTPDELIQLMRTCSMAQVREALEKAQAKAPLLYATVVEFYTLCKTPKEIKPKATQQRHPAFPVCYTCSQDFEPGEPIFQRHGHCFHRRCQPGAHSDNVVP